jgi:hypothetical protein
VWCFWRETDPLFSRQREQEFDLREREGKRERERVVGYCDRDEEEWRAWVVISWMRKRCAWRPFSWTSSRGLFFFPREFVCLWSIFVDNGMDRVNGLLIME